MADGQTAVATDPYAEFGGQSIPQASTAAPAASDPYAEFGGRTADAPQTSTGPLGTFDKPDDSMSVPGKMIAGAGKGLLKTAVGAVDLANKIPGSPTKLIPPNILEKGRQLSETHGVAEGAGAMGEEMGEWTAGEEGLKGLVSLAKVAHRAPEIMQMIEDYPSASKTILGLLKGATVGGTQGGVKGAAEGDAAGGAEAGAAGGAIGTVAAELGLGALKKGGQSIGIGRDALEEATRAGKPGKWNTRWEQDWHRALPELADRFKDVKGKGVEGVADTALRASQDLWNNDITPLIKSHENDLKDVQPVADAIRQQITPSLTKLNPARAKTIEEFANLYAGPGSNSMKSIGEMEKDVEFLNADLSANGWWEKSASERAAAIKSGQEDGMKSLAADKLRDEMYSHIESFKGPNGEPSPITDLKKTYGALRNVEHEFRGQVNVQNRQSVVSLKKILGMTAGATVGGPAGAVAAAVPFIDGMVNSPNAMAERAVKAGIPEGAASKAVKKVTAKTVKTAGGVAGEDAWIHFKSGDQHYLGHPEDWDKIQAADPNAKKVE